MKKIFPLIILLITISLLGIIYIQVSWIKNMAKVKEEELHTKVAMVMEEVAQQLVEQKSNFLPLNKVPLFPWKDQYDINRQFSIVNRFTVFEIKDKLQKAFDNNGLKETKFEFAIASNTLWGHYELKSEKFDRLVGDTTHNIQFFYPLIPSSGSLLEGLAPEEGLVVIVPNVKTFIFQSLGWMIAGAVLFTLIIISAFYLTVQTLLRQKKVSEIKSDFINNMTHEFKTPLATISLAVDALKNEKVITDKEKIEYFSGIIKDENKRMNKQVETILQAAQLDKHEVQLNLRKLHMHEIIDHALDNLRLQIEEKKGNAEVALNAEKDEIMADEVHFTNLVGNLLDNAVKYSKENLLIKISTQNISKAIRIMIEDNGIGMNKETLNRIFEKFYRAHTGNIHNVKGFGLGLSYVKTIVEAHAGKIRAESTPGKGSTFIIDVPLA